MPANRLARAAGDQLAMSRAGEEPGLAVQQGRMLRDARCEDGGGGKNHRASSHRTSSCLHELMLMRAPSLSPPLAAWIGHRPGGCPPPSP
eukprot:CAMPEP_0182539170 /NCGR_PEP_ID=MMETSP1323-20130603/24914_1 /TAXON_ID=236787 /ORGANISM="Florenciella parvula, Strain RCC1693" /LENGTH=89 /DNA_ID=CAMNT_0024749703 /DNA_START=92 /DNA_END=358 /DNA_ORIENTATION=+